MKYHVYHKRTRGIDDFSSRVPHHVRREEYDLVAEVKAVCLEEVFMMTSYDDGERHRWWRRDAVKLLKKSRSTGINDVIRDPLGDYYILSSAGWQQIRME